jgi:hypothetical protein
VKNSKGFDEETLPAFDDILRANNDVLIPEADTKLRATISRGNNAYRRRHGQQSQASLTDQLIELYAIANKSGLYDAADYVRECIIKSGGV